MILSRCPFIRVQLIDRLDLSLPQVAQAELAGVKVMLMLSPLLALGLTYLLCYPFRT